MTEKKLKPATKKVTASKTRKSSAVSSKPETTKTTVAKKTASADSRPKKTKAPVAAKTVTPAAGKKTPARKAPAEKAATPRTRPAPAENAITKPTPEERYRMVETAAYFIAEQHGFQGRSDEHWAAAEREISARLGC